MKIWVGKKSTADINFIADRYKISKNVAGVLAKRGFKSTIELDNYLFPDLKAMYNPEDMKDLKKAADILKKSIADKKKIMVIGDYDVDGIMSSYILLKGIEMLGGDVCYRIPHRVKDGYGIRDYMVDEAKELSVETIITCDNGISAVSAGERAKELGITYVITDHHEVPTDEAGNEKLPPAQAIVNPKQKECSYPFKALCGAGVAYKIMSYIFEGKGDKSYIDELLPFAAIATVCDVVPLRDENRIIVKNGLNILSDRARMKNKGMTALLELWEISDSVNSFDLGFKIGPCINAAGRLESAVKGLEMLLEKDSEKAKKIALELFELNDERKQLTNDAAEEAYRIIESENYMDRPVMVVYLEDCHESVAGIVAGRVRERYYRPAYILTKGEKDLKGSGRSIPGYHMQQELQRCQHLLTEFGGHAMAAGFSLPEENLEVFRDTLNKQCKLTEDELTERVYFDSVIPFADMDRDTVEQLKYMEPFGEDNDRATFAIQNVAVKSVYMCGKEKNIAKLQFEADGKRYYGVDFNADKCIGNAIQNRYGTKAWEDMKNGNCNGEKVDIIYVPSVNDMYGNVEFRVQDSR